MRSEYTLFSHTDISAWISQTVTILSSHISFSACLYLLSHSNNPVFCFCLVSVFSGFFSVPCRFAKNLSPDKINLSTLKGEGQLTNLELDEEVLQSLLDLPTWLAINRVCCNKAAIRVRDTGKYAQTFTKSTYRSGSSLHTKTI